MSIYFSGSGSAARYSYNTPWGSVSAFSIACWMRIEIDRNDFSTVWSLYTTTTNFVALRLDGSGTFMELTSAGTPNIYMAPGTLTVGTWYYFGFSYTGSGTCRLVYRAANATTFSQLTDTSDGNLTADFLRIADDHNGGNWLNGHITANKIWIGTALTQSELENESYTYQPVSGSVEAYYPWISTSGATVDFAGNSNTLSFIGSPASDVTVIPHISWWSQTPQKYFLPKHVYVAVGQTTETDLARRLAINVGKARETDKSKRQSTRVNRANLTNTARVITKVKHKYPGKSSETDSIPVGPPALKHLKKRTNGQLIQINTSRPITAKQSKVVAVAKKTETDKSRRLAINVGKVRETDRTRRGPYYVSRRTETDLSRQIKAQHVRKPGQSTETDTNPVGPPALKHKKTKVVNKSSHTTTAQSVLRALFVDRALETDKSRSIQNKLILRASTVETVYDIINVNKHNIINQLIETDTVRLVINPPELALETDTSMPATVNRTYATGGPVEETQTAQQVRAAKTAFLLPTEEIDKSVNLPIDVGDAIVVEMDTVTPLGKHKMRLVHWPLVHICRTVYKVFEIDRLNKPMLGLKKAIEPDTAPPVIVIKMVTVGVASESDLQVSLRFNDGELDDAGPVVHRKTVLVGDAGVCP